MNVNTSSVVSFASKAAPAKESFDLKNPFVLSLSKDDNRLTSHKPSYAELRCLTNFSFLRGASHPEELVARALTLGYSALAITDECSVAGVVRAHLAARETPLKILIGSEFRLDDGLTLILLVTDR